VTVRIRLTLAFAAVMALVLVATGLFLSLRFRSELDRTLNQGLRSRAADVTALVRQADTGLREGPRDADFAQVLDARTGRVVDGTTGLQDLPLLRRPELAIGGRVLLERGGNRLLATTVHAQDRPLIVVVGASLAPRAKALSTLQAQLLVGGPIALLLASLAGYGLASAALRPVGELLDRLRGGLARERAFTADASHELRTPLTMLSTELQLMARDRPAGPAFDAAVGAARDEADRLTTLLEDLLVLARSDAGELPLRIEGVAVADLARETAERYGNGHPVAVDVPAGLHVRGDRRHLERALGNLVHNALRHGGGAAEICAVSRGARVELHVRDRGPGIDAVFLPRAFDRFARPSAGRPGGGAGLGLAIAAAIARTHGGGAEAARRPGGGADVWLELPAAVPSARDLTLQR
jgi:two-component system OmpR family sensor kinase